MNFSVILAELFLSVLIRRALASGDVECVAYVDDTSFMTATAHALKRAVLILQEFE